MPKTHEARLLSTKQGAVYLGVAPMTLRNARCTGNIPGVRDFPRYLKFGRNVRYDIADLDAWIQAKKTRK